jgi:hypothetical protein
MKRLLSLFLVLFIVQSCTVQKRVHQKGYYVDRAFGKHHKTEISSNKTVTRSQETNPEVMPVPANGEETMLASAEADKKQLTERRSIFPGDTCGDQLVQKNGDCIKVKILEVNEAMIKYKRCDNWNGPTYTMKKNNLSEIIYSNGVREPVAVPADYVQPTQYTGPKEYPGDLVLALLCTILLGGLSPFFSIPLAKKSKEKIKKYPERYYGTILADYLIFFNRGLVVLMITLLLAFIIGFDDFVLLIILGAFLLFMVVAAFRFHKRK